MKTIARFFPVILLSLMTVSISAQQGPPPGGAPQQGQGQFQRMTPEEMAKSQTDWMKTDLKLDDATFKKVYDVVLKYAKQSSEERQKLMQAGDRDAMRAKMTEITDARDKELKPILGDKNFETFKAKEAERRAAMRPPRQN